MKKIKFPEWLKIIPTWDFQTFDFYSMAIPARICLWLGVFISILSFLNEHTLFLSIGIFLILTGGGLWMHFKENPWSLKKNGVKKNNKPLTSKTKSVIGQDKTKETLQKLKKEHDEFEKMRATLQKTKKEE